jgi:N-methylhydantoinase B
VQLASRRGDYPLAPGDVIRFDTAGGGGYGPPAERDPARIVADVLDGYVSPASAVADYGLSAEALPVAEARHDGGSAA